MLSNLKQWLFNTHFYNYLQYLNLYIKLKKFVLLPILKEF